MEANISCEIPSQRHAPPLRPSYRPVARHSRHRLLTKNHITHRARGNRQRLVAELHRVEQKSSMLPRHMRGARPLRAIRSAPVAHQLWNRVPSGPRETARTRVHVSARGEGQTPAPSSISHYLHRESGRFDRSLERQTKRPPSAAENELDLAGRTDRCGGR